MGAVGLCDALSRYLKNNTLEHEYLAVVPPLQLATATLAGISSRLHTLFPDIVPNELGSNPRILR